MPRTVFLWFAFFVFVHTLQDYSEFSSRNFGTYAQSSSSADSKATCEKIAHSISSRSQVFYPVSKEFNFDISHWANSSSQVSACSVEPATTDDVTLILQQIARDRIPFAVKGAGHTTNLGFSSTTGVQISMTRFNDIVIHEDYQTVEVGAGLTWTDVYAYLVPKGLNVIGARINGAGVAGLALGGGYSWKTNEYGLTIDTITEFHLVSPNGTQMIVTEADKDLWFALKGGFNNYGIVTKFTLKLYPQTDVWSALLTFEEDLAGPAEEAFAKFLSRPHDHKAAQTARFRYSNGSVQFAISLYYDRPEPPPGLYDELLNLSSTNTSISRSTYTDFISAQVLSKYERVYLYCYPTLQYTELIIKAQRNETKFWGDKLRKYDDSVLLSYTLEQYESDFLTHGGPSAYPPERSRAFLPSIISYSWTNASVDGLMVDAMRLSGASLVEVEIQDGQDLKNASIYGNYALFGTPLEAIYGGHLERLREIKKNYDPDNVMGLAGGWKL